MESCHVPQFDIPYGVFLSYKQSGIHQTLFMYTLEGLEIDLRNYDCKLSKDGIKPGKYHLKVFPDCQTNSKMSEILISNLLDHTSSKVHVKIDDLYILGHSRLLTSSSMLISKVLQQFPSEKCDNDTNLLGDFINNNEFVKDNIDEIYLNVSFIVDPLCSKKFIGIIENILAELTLMIESEERRNGYFSSQKSMFDIITKKFCEHFPEPFDLAQTPCCNLLERQENLEHSDSSLSLESVTGSAGEDHDKNFLRVKSNLVDDICRIFRRICEMPFLDLQINSSLPLRIHHRPIPSKEHLNRTSSSLFDAVLLHPESNFQNISNLLTISTVENFLQLDDVHLLIPQLSPFLTIKKSADACRMNYSRALEIIFHLESLGLAKLIAPIHQSTSLVLSPKFIEKCIKPERWKQFVEKFIFSFPLQSLLKSQEFEEADEFGRAEKFLLNTLEKFQHPVRITDSTIFPLNSGITKSNFQKFLDLLLFFMWHELLQNVDSYAILTHDKHVVHEFLKTSSSVHLQLFENAHSYLDGMRPIREISRILNVPCQDLIALFEELKLYILVLDVPAE